MCGAAAAAAAGAGPRPAVLGAAPTPMPSTAVKAAGPGSTRQGGRPAPVLLPTATNAAPARTARPAGTRRPGAPRPGLRHAFPHVPRTSGTGRHATGRRRAVRPTTGARETAASTARATSTQGKPAGASRAKPRRPRPVRGQVAGPRAAVMGVVTPTVPGMGTAGAASGSTRRGGRPAPVATAGTNAAPARTARPECTRRQAARAPQSALPVPLARTRTRRAKQRVQRVPWAGSLAPPWDTPPVHYVARTGSSKTRKDRPSANRVPRSLTTVCPNGSTPTALRVYPCAIASVEAATQVPGSSCRTVHATTKEFIWPMDADNTTPSAPIKGK